MDGLSSLTSSSSTLLLSVGAVCESGLPDLLRKSCATTLGNWKREHKGREEEKKLDFDTHVTLSRK